MIIILFWTGHEAAGKTFWEADHHQLPSALVEDVVVGAEQVLETYFTGCHMMLAAPDYSIRLGLVQR